MRLLRQVEMAALDYRASRLVRAWRVQGTPAPPRALVGFAAIQPLPTSPPSAVFLPASPLTAADALVQVQASAGQANEENIATWTEATYQAGLDAAQRLVASHRVGEAGLKKRSAAMESLTAWLARGEGQRTLQACTPKDIVVYLTKEYLPKHQGSDKHTHTHTNIQTYNVQGAGQTKLCLLWIKLKNRLDGCAICGPQEGRCCGLNMCHPRAAES